MKSFAFFGALALLGVLAIACAPTPTPTQRLIAFSSGRAGGDLNWKIYVMNADGTGQRRLTDNAPAEDYAAHWSPDGRSIAFGSNRDGNGEVYVMNADGTGQRRLTNNPALNAGVAWQP